MRSLAAVVLAVVIALSMSLSAQAACQDQWIHNFSLEFSAGAWDVGEHEYRIVTELTTEDGVVIAGDFTHAFTVTPDAPLRQGQVRLGPAGPQHPDGVSEIHPDQDTFMQVSWIGFGTRKESEFGWKSSWAQFAWDGGELRDIAKGPLTPRCGEQARFLRHWGQSAE